MISKRKTLTVLGLAVLAFCVVIIRVSGPDKSYVMMMPGSTNTKVASTFFARPGLSYYLCCEFKDQTTNGWTNWTRRFLLCRRT